MATISSRLLFSNPGWSKRTGRFIASTINAASIMESPPATKVTQSGCGATGWRPLRRLTNRVATPAANIANRAAANALPNTIETPDPANNTPSSTASITAPKRLASDLRQWISMRKIATQPQSTRAPLSLTTLPHFTISFLMWSAYCSGVLPTGSMPSRSNRSRISGTFSVLATSV